uniref:cation:proton antiporter n=1 Tax=Thaumasiovibrio occultus TaxID=1891184 RepID=UPI000B35A86C|nr:cation:proton antiporter [Thaumasiovibrio occultus]
MSYGLLFFFVLFFGLYGSKIAQRCKLPGAIGLILVGVVISQTLGAVMPSSLSETGGFLKSLALTIILLKAGLGISLSQLKTAGRPAALMTFIPCLFEGSALTWIFHSYFDFSLAVAGLTAFMLAAVSPAVVVPTMLEMKAKGYGKRNEVPTIVLAGASVDDVVAITLFSLCLGFATSGNADITVALLSIPYAIIGGLIPGVLLGVALTWVFGKFSLPIVEKLLLLLTLSTLLVEFGHWSGVAALLGVMAVGFILLERSRQSAEELSTLLGHLWSFAQIVLFVLIGMAVDLDVAFEYGLGGLAAITVGLVFRSIGVWVATTGSKLNVRERVFCIVAYLPKATVQAALGGVALAAGIEEGSEILAYAVLAIVFTAPLGLIGITTLAPRLLVQDGKSNC